MRHPLLPSLMLIASVTLGACGTITSHAAADSVRTDPEAVMNDDLTEPLVPDSIFDPMARADYQLLHFWDPIAPDDPRMADEDWLERNFARYAALYDYASDTGADYAVSSLVAQTESYPELLKAFGRLAQKHLYHRESEHYNPTAFTSWLRHLSSSSALSEADKVRYRYMLEASQKNAPGSVAADFSFTDRSGTPRTLHTLPRTPWTLLIFYDPDCDTCHEIIASVRADKKMTDPVRAGQVRVLLVDVADDADAFRRDAASLPAEWIVGYDTSRVEDNDIYIFDTTPVIYLLDSERRVVLKEATIEQLREFARSHGG